MMLVVFTAFLGMELKTAVGTSTFIMTFTALIASVSHILIHPAIVLEKCRLWPGILSDSKSFICQKMGKRKKRLFYLYQYT